MWFHKRYDFLAMLLAQAQMSEKGLEALCEFAKAPTLEKGRIVSDIEKEADRLRRELIEALNLTFITPFDREDVFALSRAIDDMVDYANSTVEEMMLFEAPTDRHLQAMAESLHEASKEITLAVEGLRGLRRKTQEHLIRAKKLENRTEHQYREALADLFKNTDIVRILKLREVYRHLSNAADRGDEAADIIGDILVKNT